LPEAILTARQIDDLFRFMAAVGSALYVFIFGYIVYFAIAFRAKKGDDPNAIGVQVHDDVRLEVLWTILPALFVVLLSIISVKIWYEITLQPANGLVVEAIGTSGTTRSATRRCTARLPTRCTSRSAFRSRSTSRRPT